MSGTWLAPWDWYGLARDQLGSVRGTYLGRNLVVRHEDFGAGKELVLLVQGFFQTRNVWEIMEDRLRHDGYGVMSFHLGGLLSTFNTHPVDRTAGLIATKIERLASRYGFDGIHIVGHSLGGLIARRYIHDYGGHRRVKSLTTLGTPHKGTPVAAVAVGIMGFGMMESSAFELLPRSTLTRQLHGERLPGDVPFTSIYSNGDMLCPNWSAHLDPDRDHPLVDNVHVPNVGHTALVWDARVYRAVQRTLEDGTRRWRDGRRTVEAP